ncbi:MAG: DUF499 domain-containing protein [Sulfolobales archaeon]
MVLLGNNKIREDVFDESLDERLAPSLGNVILGLEPEIYTDPGRFFSITLITEQITDILSNIARVLNGEPGRKVVLLSALFGGGKTHTLITIYHALKAPNHLYTAIAENQEIQGLVRTIAERLSSISGSTDVVVIDGNTASLAPHPIAPLRIGGYTVKTLWGYIAHALGSYSSLREYDDKGVPPEIDTLVKLFSDRRVVILIDEIGAYIKSLYESADPGLKTYASAVATFMERLAKAVDVSKSVVLVVSLPVVVGGEGDIKNIERVYRSIEDILASIAKALGRVSPIYIEPVSPRNIPALLRARLFSYIDTAKASEIRSSLLNVYRNNEVFDQDLAKRVSTHIVETYPFHPLYIDTLIDILDKHEMLQKTRDLLRISRAILRSIARGGEGYELIMPWHIDLADPSLSAYLLKGFEGFRTVIENDIRDRARRYEKPLLAEIIAKALLARTFVYGGVLTPKVEVFPTQYELAVMVYEPYIFGSQGILPKDIIDAISWIKQNLVHVLEDEASKRLWFTHVVTPIKYVEDTARSIADADAVKEVVELANRLLTQEITSLKSRRGRKAERSRIFDEELSTVSYSCERLDYDNPRYILYACINIPEDIGKRVALLEEITYNTKSGGSRRYANTIYIAYPSTERFRIALEYVRKHIACKEVENRGVIDLIARDFREEERKIVVEILKGKLRDYCNNVYERALENILTMFNIVTYPTYRDGRNTVGEAVIESRETIMKSAEHALQAMQPRKVYSEMDFYTLSFLLRSIGIDLANMDAPRTVREVVEYFYSNPRLPAAPGDIIRRAIAEGVKTLDIGIACNDKIYYKVIQRCSSERDCLAIEVAEGEDISNISNDCLVLPWRIALIDQMRRLRKSQAMHGGAMVVIQHFLKIGEKLYDVEEVLSNIDKYDLGTLKNMPLVSLERRVSVTLKPDSVEIDADPGEDIERTFLLERSGPFEGEVILQIDRGHVEPERIAINNSTPRAEIRWRLKAPEEGGIISAVLKAIDISGSELASARIFIKVRKEEAKCFKGLPSPGTRIERIGLEINQLNLKPLKILSTRFGQLIVSSGRLELTLRRGDISSRVGLEIENTNIDEAVRIIQSIISTLSLGETSISLVMRLRAKEPISMPGLPEKDIDDLQPYITEICVGD